jgi:TrmH family RNA methyltransferase
VLHRPRDVVNIGGVVRAMKNMHFRHLRLVAPAPFMPTDVLRIAHRSEDILAALRFYDTLDVALADATYIIGTTEHLHGEHQVQTDVRALAPLIWQHAAQGKVALLFGTENNGLDKAALDRCHILLRLPTSDAYPSLNLAQAVLLLLYELHMAQEQTPLGVPAAPPPATFAHLEEVFGAWETALQTIEFFKTPQRSSVMRTLRAIIHRAAPTQEETALLAAIAREVVHFVRRKQKDGS